MSARRLTIVAARALTLLRFATIVPFAWLLAFVIDNPSPEMEAMLAALYVAVIASDFIDGRLARAADGASPGWGRFDAVADISFNLASLTVAAAAGIVRSWLPVTLGLLGARYLWVAFATRPATALPVDLPGKVAGILYYAMVGLVVVHLTHGIPGAVIVARLGDALIVYGAWLFVRGLGAAESPRGGDVTS